MMIKRTIRTTRFFSRTAILIIVILAAYGCASAPDYAGPQPDPVPLPVYQKGTTFVYSDGTWERVESITSDVITWRDHRGNLSGGSPDFTYRQSMWETRSERGTRQFGPRTDLIAEDIGSLWPLRRGNVTRYSEISIRSEKGGLEKTSYSNWTCKVDGREGVSVMMGDFDTWKIDCTRYSTPRTVSKARPVEVKTWYYAPQIGHFVLTTRKYFTGKPPKRLELLAVLPSRDGLSAEAQQRMDAGFQKAMEFEKSGQSVSWSIPNTAVSGEIAPAGTFRLADGTYCRRYVQKLNLPDGRQTFYGIAVRDAKGVWSVPHIGSLKTHS
jgi:surface antigen